MPKNQPLTFEEFVESGIAPRYDGSPRYDSFLLYFMPDGMAPYLRQTSYFLDFQAKELDLEVRLTQNITHRDKSIDVMEALKPFESDMYQAYLIMFEYLVRHDSVDPNEDLLIGPK